MVYFRLFSIIGSAALFALVIDFIRRGLLKEKYSVLWLASSVVIATLSIKKDLLDYIAGVFGIAYPPSLLFLVAFIFVLLITLHFSVVISIQHERNKRMAQELALLREAMKEAGISVPDGEGKKKADG
ncbi:MAG: DUF2304 domain-containing protein [Deltaproteobacteria bacterium]|nr:DUF2304 domain-containing protein [Deltaproteobacteria bacterium]